jgi:glycosyltransferase involved in cell wall biosynthesis
MKSNNVFGHFKDKDCTFFISTLGGGGAEGVCVNLANKLTELGWSITVVVLTLKDQTYLNRLSCNVKLVNLDVCKASKSFFHILNFLIKNKPSKILAFNYELSVILNAIKFFLRLDIVLISRNINTIQNVIEHIKKRNAGNILVFLIKIFYSKSNFVVNQSHGMQKSFLDIFPSMINKVAVINNPVNELYTFAPDFIDNNSDEYILCVGRLEAQKGFDRAIECFSFLSKIYPNLRLKIVGDGSLKSNLSELCFSLGLSGKVDFIDFEKDLRYLYANAKLTLLTSHYEGFPNVLVESIAMGTPIVALDCLSGPSEIVQPYNGLLVSSASELTAACQNLLDNPLDRLAVAQTATRYEAGNIAKKYSDVMDAVK